MVYKWYFSCQLGEEIIIPTTFRGTRNNHGTIGSHQDRLCIITFCRQGEIVWALNWGWEVARLGGGIPKVRLGWLVPPSLAYQWENPLVGEAVGKQKIWKKMGGEKRDQF